MIKSHAWARRVYCSFCALIHIETKRNFSLLLDLSLSFHRVFFILFFPHSLATSSSAACRHCVVQMTPFVRLRQTWKGIISFEYFVLVSLLLDLHICIYLDIFIFSYISHVLSMRGDFKKITGNLIGIFYSIPSIIILVASILNDDKKSMSVYIFFSKFPIQHMLIFHLNPRPSACLHREKLAHGSLFTFFYMCRDKRRQAFSLSCPLICPRIYGRMGPSLKCTKYWYIKIVGAIYDIIWLKLLRIYMWEHKCGILAKWGQGFFRKCFTLKRN